MLVQLKQTDTGISLVYKLENPESNQAVDLTGATVNFVMGDNSKIITFNDAVVSDAANGVVSYTFTDEDTLIAGMFLAEFEVTFQDGMKKTYPRDGYINVDIQKNVDKTKANVVADVIAVRQSEFATRLQSIETALGGENIVTNEEERKTNETARQSAETTRQLNETTRQQALADMQTATQEAITATSSANLAANTANTAATFAQEQGTFAKTQGEFAQAQGTFAQTEAVNLATIKAEAEAAITGATTAAIGANTAKANAETATLNANTATTNANTATTNANNAATYATEQGNYAKAQGEAAQAIIESGTVSSVNTKTGAVVLTATDVGAIPTTEKGTANGVATLGADGKVPQEQLDINIDTSTLATKDDLSSLATKDSLDNLAGVGRTTETVKGNADALALHQADETNPHSVTKEQVGLGNVDNVKQASKADFDNHTGASKVGAHYAKNIALEDKANNFVSTEIEGAMAELFTNVSNGKALVGTAITDVDPNVSVPTEPSFSDLATAIGSISAGSIKSIQRGTLVLSTATSEQVSISPVDTTKSIVRLNYDTDNMNANVASLTVSIINSTTIEFKSNNGTTGRTVSYEVIEFQNLKSLQKGETTIASASTSSNLTINAVDVNKALIFVTCRSAVSGTSTASFLTESKFIDSTTIQFSRHLAENYVRTINYQVIEFN